MQNKLQIGYIMRHAIYTPNDQTFFMKHVKGVKIRPLLALTKSQNQEHKRLQNMQEYGNFEELQSKYQKH